MFENRESSSEVECLRKTNLRFPSELSNPPNLASAMSPQLTQLKQMSPQHTQLNPISPRGGGGRSAPIVFNQGKKLSFKQFYLAS